MLKKFSRLGIFICVMCQLSGCSNYTDYVPVSLVVKGGDHVLTEDPSLLTKEHIEAMKIILSRYGEDYKIADGKLMIKASLKSDKDLLQNYTFKAEVLRRETSISPESESMSN